MSLAQHYKLRIPLGLIWSFVTALCLFGWDLMFKETFYISVKNTFALLAIIWYVSRIALAPPERKEVLTLPLDSAGQAQQLYYLPLLRLSRYLRSPRILLVSYVSMDHCIR